VSGLYGRQEHEVSRSRFGRVTAWSVSAAVAALLLLLGGAAVAGPPGLRNVVPQPNAATPRRVRGKRAIMHVYFYAPKTLEITHVDSLFFRDPMTCEDSLDAALRVARLRAQDGDEVDADCASIKLSTAIERPDLKPLPFGYARV
jgi:hypothetical protein